MNPQNDEPIRTDSLSEHAAYAGQDDVHVKMAPGTYEITIDNYEDFYDCK